MVGDLEMETALGDEWAKKVKAMKCQKHTITFESKRVILQRHTKKSGKKTV